MGEDQPKRRRAYSIGVAIDWFSFVFAGLAAIWLAYLSLTETFRVGWWGILLAVLFWALLAYLVLPRLHRILTSVYVPDYFIGRARTSDGLLGDPVNLAVLGEQEPLEHALRAAGWTKADPVTLASSWRIITSTVTGRSYHQAPVSPLFLFGRQQDFAYQQEVDGNPAQRHHVRFWRCPDGWLLPGGRRVDWLAAGTFDTSVGLSLFTLQVTHKIDADTDVERDHIIKTVMDADPRVAVEIITDFATGYHSRNGGGDSIRTDGDLPILDVRAVSANDTAARGSAAADATRAGAGAASVEGAAEGAERFRVSTADDAQGAGQRIGVAEPAGRDARETVRPPAKRRAYEPAVRLLAPIVYDPDMRRPAATVAGVVLVLLRVLAGILLLVGLAAGWDQLLADADVVLEDVDPSSDAARLALWAVLGVGAAVILTDLLLAFLILRGVNWPRVVVMAISIISISTAFVAWWAQGQEITLEGTLLSLSLDILVLLALSSHSAAAYARRNERR